MPRLFYMFALLSFYNIVVSAERLRCYVCHDCPLPDIKDIKVCNTTSTAEVTPLPYYSTATEETMSTTTEANNTTLIIIPTDLSNQRKKRAVQDEPTSGQGCICDEVPCDCSTASTTTTNADGNTIMTDAPPTVTDATHTVSDATTTITNATPTVTDDTPTVIDTTTTGISTSPDVKYECYKHMYKNDDDFIVIDRDCRVINGPAPCVNDTPPGTICSFCQTKACNSAISIKISVALILFLLGMQRL